MDKVFPLIIIIAAIAVFTLFILYYMNKLNGQANAAKILQYGREREYFIYEMLRSAFPRGTVMRNLFFPVRTNEGVFDTEADIVCVTRGGIAVIEVKGSKGHIDCPLNGPWCQRYGKKVLYFESPYKQNEGHVKAIGRALAAHGIAGVPIRNYVVFTDLNVRFSQHYPWLFRSDKIVDAVEAMDNKLILTHKDQKYISEIMRRYKKRRHPTFRVKHKHDKQRRIHK